MISLESAEEIISKNARVLNETERVDLDSARDRILAEDVFSDTDMPPFDKSAMDGYACRRVDLIRPLTVVETIAAGTEPSCIIGSGECARIMTGAKVPVGADCVVMIEHTILADDGKVIVKDSNVQDNVCRQGEDIKKGSLVLRKGSFINPQTIALLASAGKTVVQVTAKLQVGLLCTGSELVEPDIVPSGVQIRNSNAAQLIAQIEAAGAIPAYCGIIPDNRDQIAGKVNEMLGKYPVVLITGGASVGDFDFMPEILQQPGFTVHFKQVGIQPGKPVVYATCNDRQVFGLSGNPVSSFLQFELLVKPLLFKMYGSAKHPQNIKMILGEPVKRKQTERRFFQPVTVNPYGQIINTEFHGSAHIAALKNIFGFAIIPEGIAEIKKGEVVNVRPI